MSRILDNSSEIRSNLNARNLYSPNNPYDVNTSELVSTVSRLSEVLLPFSTIDLSNTIIGRLIGDNTPLAQIGIQMLSKQLSATAASNAAAELIPDIRFSNLFDGDPNTRLITRKIDFQITRRETQSTVGRILEEIAGTVDTEYPFGPDSTTVDFIKNTGKGQLQTFITNVNRNIYKASSKSYIDAVEGEGLKVYDGSEIISTRTYFSSTNAQFYPFTRYQLEFADAANAAIRLSESLVRTASERGADADNYLEYGATQEFLDNLGDTIIRNNNDGGGNYIIEPQDFGFNQDSTKQLVWGRDGISEEYSQQAGGFDRIFEGVDNNGQTPSNPRFNTADNINNFNINNGLLNYTKELLNAQGQYGMFDLTRKKFIDRDDQLHFNGSPLTKDINGQTNRSRQHSIADPYDRYVKAIRYNGNKIYNGNENSVIHDTVMPRIHPTLGNDGIINNRNLMFSIENLAAVVIADRDPLKNIGYLDDEFGTEIPLCEVGPNSGRMMWFPPYDIQLSEQAISRHETTNFIGRGEPIYTYNTSERLATLSFKLLIDYPPQVAGLDHADAARFFAFGGNGNSTAITNIGDKEAQKSTKIRQRDEIQPTVVQADPQINFPTPLSFHFPNDEPGNSLAVNGGIQSIIDLGYEDGVFIQSSEIDGRDTALNVNFINSIDEIIETYLGEETREFIRIEIIGSASQLFRGPDGNEYNLELSERRINSMIDYIDTRYKSIFNGRSLSEDNIDIVTNPLGAVGGTATDDEAEIPSDAAKQARAVQIRVVHNGRQQTSIRELTPDEIQIKNALDIEIQQLDEQIRQQRKNAILNTTCIFNEYTLEDGVLKGFEPTQLDKYKPVFHSQTPEDFHRRLTFLHQCTRQGNAVRKTRESSDGTISFSAKNAVFGRQPVQVLRIGDFFHTKVIIDNISFEFGDAPWDTNPEGHGMQFMIADITMQMKVIGGQSLKTPIDALQNAVSFNYYANSTYSSDGIYETPNKVEAAQVEANEGILANTRAATLDSNSVVAQKFNQAPSE